MAGHHSPVDDLLAVVAEVLDAPVVALTSPVPGEGPLLYGAADHPDAIAEAVPPAERWLRTDGRRDGETGRFRVGGWSVLFVALGEDVHVPDRVVVLGRPDARPWTEADVVRVDVARRLFTKAYEADLLLLAPRAGRSSEVSERAIARWLDAPRPTPRSRVAVCVIDVDGFTVVEEVLGRSIGERFLAEMFRRLMDEFGVGASVSLLPYARFVVLAERAPLDVDELVATLSASIDLDGHRLSRSVAIGVATGFVDGAPGAVATRAVRSLIARAAESAQAAAADGGNCAHRYDETVAAQRRARFQLELEITEAREGGQLELYFQPEVDLRTWSIVAVEGLLRWRHPRLGLLIAGAFIDVAEKSHALQDIGDWVVAEAISTLADWRTRFPAVDLTMRINAAAGQFVGDHLSRTVLDAIVACAVPPDRVCIEITERQMPTDLDAIVAELTRLRAAGVAAAIDDFGTGQSTLVHALTLPVGAIKLDRTFVSAMRRDRRAHVVVEAMIKLAHDLDLDVVAEGIEERAIADDLVRLGCRRGQGSLLGAPVPAVELERMLGGDLRNET